MSYIVREISQGFAGVYAPSHWARIHNSRFEWYADPNDQTAWIQKLEDAKGFLKDLGYTSHPMHKGILRKLQEFYDKGDYEKEPSSVNGDLVLAQMERVDDHDVDGLIQGF